MSVRNLFYRQTVSAAHTYTHEKDCSEKSSLTGCTVGFEPTYDSFLGYCVYHFTKYLLTTQQNKRIVSSQNRNEGFLLSVALLTELHPRLVGMARIRTGDTQTFVLKYLISTQRHKLATPEGFEPSQTLRQSAMLAITS